MSVQAAIQFIHRVRADPALRHEIGALDGGSETMDRLIAVGARAGFQFTVEELQRAHAHDWAMRWAYFSMTPSSQRKHDA